MKCFAGTNRFLCWLLCAGLCVHGAGAVSTSAKSAVLMDAASGRVLCAQDASTPRSIASITKLMTALVCVETFADLDAEVLIPPEAAGVEGSSMYLKPMEKYTVRQLLYGLLLRSGNDAAVALAIVCSGDVETFVAAMNDRAQALGMTATHFANPHGLDDPAHYSTALDMARLAREVLRHPALAEICSSRSYTLNDQTLLNHNKLLWRYDGCIGFKTGYTQSSGRTLVSGATREEGTLLAVTLDDPDDWADHAALLDYGFAHFREYPLCRAGKRLCRLRVEGSVPGWVEVAAAEDLACMLSSQEEVVLHLELPDCVSAPVAVGDVLGSLTVSLEGTVIVQTPLIAASAAGDDRRTGLFSRAAPILSLARVSVPVWHGSLTRIPQGG